MLSADVRLADKYVLLDRVDVHCVWVSQAVLDLLPSLPDEVPGGEIVRDPGLGVFCDNAMDLVYARWPKPGAEKKLEYLRSAAESLHSFGLVGVHDASVWPEHVALYEMLIAQDAVPGMTNQHGDAPSTKSVPAAWTLRVYAMLECPERNTFCAEHARQILPESNGGMLAVQSVKLFGDGALGSWGSAMLEPYSDRPDWQGGLLVNASTMAEVTKQWAEHGFQVNIHAIGDEANRVALDAMEAALKDVCDGEDLAACQSRRRFRIEHTQIIHPDDQKRMRNMGIIPSIQPTHATSDMKYAELRLGPERTASEAYRMRSLLDIGLVLGSDFPVEPPNPFEGLYAAITRKSPHTGRGADGSENGWHVEEALTRAQALEGFTKGAARGAFLEGKAGVIAKGAYADWVVLDKPLAEYGVEDLRTLKVRETWIGGRRVYERP
jgi:predicted amidohydrolase YtcJ